jgi:Ser/Thr protein kinase RdoA (MazF antagonist)
MEQDPHSYGPTELGARVDAGWGIDPASLVHFRTGANNVFRASRARSPVFIKVTAASMRVESEISGASAFQRHLGDKGAPISNLEMKENGNRYDVFDFGGRTYFVTVSQAAIGEVLDKSSEDPDVFAAWGEAMAQLHNAAEDFDRSSFPYLAGEGEWLRIIERFEDASNEMKGRIEEIGAWRSSLPVPRGGLALTHGDMNAGNVVLFNGKATLIDFDEPIVTWNAADIARPFCETAAQDDATRAKNFVALFEGYAKHRTPEFLSPSDYENFITLKCLETYGWMTKVWTDDAFLGEDKTLHLARLEALILNPLKLA